MLILNLSKLQAKISGHAVQYLPFILCTGLFPAPETIQRQVQVDHTPEGPHRREATSLQGN